MILIKTNLNMISVNLSKKITKNFFVGGFTMFRIQMLDFCGTSTSQWFFFSWGLRPQNPRLQWRLLEIRKSGSSWGKRDGDLTRCLALGIQWPKLRMASWNRNTMRFFQVIGRPLLISWEYDDWCLGPRVECSPSKIWEDWNPCNNEWFWNGWRVPTTWSG